MKFRIDQPVFVKFPDLVVAIPVITGFDNTKGRDEPVAFLRETEKNLRDALTFDTLTHDPRATVYFDAFRNFGVDPEKFLPAHVALSRRVLEGKDIPDINPMVNVYNALSIKYLTPFGGEDFDAVSGDFVLKFAKGGEIWIPIGSIKSKPAVAGELVWGDDVDLSTRALNWRQCERTKLTKDSTNGYFIMDGFASVNRDTIEKASEEFVALATKLFGGQSSIYWLDKETPVAAVPFVSKKVSKAVKAAPALVKKPVEYRLRTFRGQLQALLTAVFKEIGVSDVTPEVEIPENPAHGEYTTNVAMKAWPKLVQSAQFAQSSPPKSPIEFALQIKNAIRLKQPHPNTHQKDQTKSAKFAKPALPAGGLDQDFVLSSLSRVEVAPPGFINFFLTEAVLSSRISEVLDKKEAYGTAPSIPSDPSHPSRRVIVEFTDPNPFKEFHIGHLYSNAVGESICRLFEASGCDVKRADYYGDVGMHVAKSIWGMLHKSGFVSPNSPNIPNHPDIPSLASLPLSDRVKWMGEAYAVGSKAFDEDPTAAEEMKRLNKLIYEKDESVHTLYQTCRQWSLDYFETLYARLGTTFDLYYPESEVGEYGAKLVMDHIGTIFEKSDGAIIYRGEEDGLHTRVFINTLGLPTYEAKELGVNDKKYKDWPFDASYIVTAKEIDEYFKVLLSAMGKVIPEVAAKTTHIGHGMVKLPEGKMSSRTGKILTGEWLLDSLKQKIYTILDKNDTYNSSEKEEIAEKAAVAAVKYSLLKVALPSDITFDLETSVSFDGDSGPYLLYTYARCRSVLRRAEEFRMKNEDVLHSPFSILHSVPFNPQERSVARLITHFPDVVAAAAASLSPSTVCTYLNRLASAFNLFYAKHQILTPDTPYLPNTPNLRIALTAATAQVLQNGLHLLGIQTVERM